MSGLDLRDEVRRAIGEGVDAAWPKERFNELALRLFASQFERNPPYRRFCQSRGAQPGRLRSWREIPALPTAAFKEAAIFCYPQEDASVIYRTSGTTREDRRGRHLMRDTALYDAALVPNLQAYVFPDVERIRIAVLALAPPEAPQSSLTHMLDAALERWEPQTAATI